MKVEANTRLERFLYRIRTSSGLLLIVLFGLQILTGYALARKVALPLDTSVSFWLHKQFSWILVFLFLTHATVALGFRFRLWWPQRVAQLVPVLAVGYVAAVVATLIVQFAGGL